ncbi:hypothetical protein EJB05_32356, partial [Eragrostis curvula]
MYTAAAARGAKIGSRFSALLLSSPSFPSSQPRARREGEEISRRTHEEEESQPHDRLKQKGRDDRAAVVGGARARWEAAGRRGAGDRAWFAFFSRPSSLLDRSRNNLLHLTPPSFVIFHAYACVSCSRRRAAALLLVVFADRLLLPLISLSECRPAPATGYFPAFAGGNHRLQGSMAIAVGHGHCHDLKPPAARIRHCRLRSVAQLDRDHHQEHGSDADGGGHTGLSPKRRTQSSPCFTTVAASGGGQSHAEEAEKKKTMPRVEVVAGRHARGVRELIAEAAGAITSGTRLVPAQSGLGGALLLNDGRSGEHVAVIKFLDDGDESSASSASAGSPAAANGTTGGGYAKEAVLREVAAFLLDHDGFASVEPTALVRISRPASSSATTTTMASIQRFVAHEYDAGELGPSRFSVASVHRVGILDVRLLNIDRHAGNILVKNPPSAGMSTTTASSPPLLDLVPIDHGLCLPEQLDDPYFEWLHWPQASLPFSDDELAYIASLDPFKDAEMLRVELPALKEPAIRILTLCTVFLKRAAAAGLCLADIGDMMTREVSAMEEGMSALETLCKECHDSVRPPLPSPGGDGVSEGATTFSSGGRKHVSFGHLSGEEWAAFLDRFEQRLPAALLDDKKRAGEKL